METCRETCRHDLENIQTRYEDIQRPLEHIQRTFDGLVRHITERNPELQRPLEVDAVAAPLAIPDQEQHPPLEASPVLEPELSSESELGAEPTPPPATA
jgi:hypothetical protein